MNRTYLAEILSRYSVVARPVIRKFFRADSCIASTRITARVLKKYGVEVLPVSADVIVYNPMFNAALKAGEKFPADPIRARIWMDERKAWSVGIGYQPPNPKTHTLGGHLYGYLPEFKLAIDASIDQADRPEHGIILPQVVFADTDDPALPFGIDTDSGSAVVYTPHEDQQMYRKVYLQSPNWKSNQTDRAVKLILDLIS